MPSLGSLTGIFGKFGKKASPPPLVQPPEMQCTVLPNGMEVWSIYNPNAYTHEFEIGRKTGLLSDPPEFPHLSHLEEHLWGHNFPGMNAAGWYEWCATKEIQTNFTTSLTNTRISGASKDIPTLLEYADLVSSAMTCMNFTNDDVIHEQGVVTDELMNMQYHGSPKGQTSYAKKMSGHEDTTFSFDPYKLKKANAEDVYNHATKQMVGGNLYALSIGNIPHKLLTALVQNKFGHLPSGITPSKPTDHIIKPETICWNDNKNRSCNIALGYNIPKHIADMHSGTSLIFFSHLISDLLEQNVRNSLRSQTYAVYTGIEQNLTIHTPKFRIHASSSPENFPRHLVALQAGIMQVIHGTPDESITARVKKIIGNRFETDVLEDFKRSIRAGVPPKTRQEQYDALASLSPAKFRQTLKDIVSTPPLIYLSGSLPPAHLRPTPEGFTSAFTNVNVKDIANQPNMAPRR